MASYFCSSVAGDNTTGASWATAKTTLTGALALATASGDIVFVDAAHTESTASAAVTLDAPTSATAISVISVTRSGTGTANTGQAAGASVTVGTNAFSLTIGNARIQALYFFGIAFHVNNGASASNFIKLGGAFGGQFEFESCTFDTPGSSTSVGIAFSTSALSPISKIRLINCTVVAPNVAGAAQFNVGFAEVFISNLTLTFSATKPTTLFKGNTAPSDVRIVDSDLSPYNAASSAYVNVATINGGTWLFRNCKLNATPTIVAGTWVGNNTPSVTVINCDSNDTHNIFAYYTRLGTITIDTSVYATSGALFDTANLSWKIVTTAACSKVEPFVTPWLYKWNTSTSSLVASLEINHDNATLMNDLTMWAEFEYLGSATFPNGTMASNRNAAPMDGSGSNWATGALSWTGTGGFTNPNPQKTTKTFTPAEKSLQAGRLCVGVASKTLYLDPELILT